MKNLAAFSVIGISLLAGCSDSFTPTPAPGPFSMQVIPEQISYASPDQKFVFLVTVADEGEGSYWGAPVNISASAENAGVIVYPQAIIPGEVSEITVFPSEVNSEGALTVIINSELDGLEQTDSISFELNGMEDRVNEYAQKMRRIFIPWLGTTHTELGITSETEWTGTVVIPGSYEVSYYLFFSDQWEMGVQWHVTSAEADWARIYLRRRFAETTPSYAFEISSYSARDPVPYAITVPDSVYR